MDSLKIPKGNNSGGGGGGAVTGGNQKQPTGNVPITVRFNAGEESIDDFFQTFHNTSGASSAGNSSGGNANSGGGDSLSSSPSHLTQQQMQNIDEANQRNNFLQSNFFNRKRAGSVEVLSPTSSGPNLIAALSGGDASSVGTWKLIKGKVSQTIEDIKSSKSSSSSTLSSVLSKAEQPLEADSDQETSAANKTLTEKVFLDLEHKPVHLQKPQKAAADSDSELEFDTLLEGFEVERSRLRRGFDQLKSKVKAKSATHLQQPQTMNPTTKPIKKESSPKKETSPSPIPSTSATLKSTFLRRRKNIETGEIPPNSKVKKVAISGKRDYEIESGVEMMEDMIPPATHTDAKSIVDSNIADSDVPIESETVISKVNYTEMLENESSMKASNVQNTLSQTFERAKKSFPFYVLLMLLLVLWLPIHDFIRGVLATLLSIVLLDSISATLQIIIEYFLVTTPPEKTKFHIPDYRKMNVMEIPAIEEYKTVKGYKGWMNEIGTYDPNNFHISMTRPVYVKLDGTILTISNTNARIPKRAIWNEPPIIVEHVKFIQHRTYDLLNCRIELLPIGLAKKRYFSRKYPIQIIVLNKNPAASVETNISKNPSTSSFNDSSDVIFLDALDSSRSQLTDSGKQSQQLSSTSLEKREEHIEEKNIDFAETILNANLEDLQNTYNPDSELKAFAVPFVDETEILLFSRTAREKEDWFRRFTAASKGDVHDQELYLPNVKFTDEGDLQAAAAKRAIHLTKSKHNNKVNTNNDHASTSSPVKLEPSASLLQDLAVIDYPKVVKTEKPTTSKTPDEEDIGDDITSLPDENEPIDGLLLSWCAARNPQDYLQFMTLYQSACRQHNIPVFKKIETKIGPAEFKRRLRRARRMENELWKGIDQSLFLGPSGSVVWANLVAGRILFSCLHNAEILEKFKILMQKKINSVHFPNFLEEVEITTMNLGNKPPLIHRISQPMLDERGLWIDADATYEGAADITITTKLNLMRLKRESRNNLDAKPDPIFTDDFAAFLGLDVTDDLPEQNSGSAIYDSDAETSGGSSSESETAVNPATLEPTSTNEPQPGVGSSPNNARRIFKIVDRIAASNLFHYATELPYIQRAMENMSAPIHLLVEIKGFVGRVTVNIPPPPSDRLWFGFRGPPRLWIAAKPTLGDKAFDWTIVTNIIESKLCEEVNKLMVYPNMVDLTIPLLGFPTYKDKDSDLPT